MPDDGAATAQPSPDRPTGDPRWDDWETPPRVPAIPVLHLDGFDGPMDLLLDLAERQRIDLGRISVLALVEQFVAAMERLTAQVPVERRADWVVVATRLVLLRSKLLFPPSSEAVAEAAHEIERLDALRFVRAAASWLQVRPQLGHDVFARPRSGPDPRVASYMALMEACLTVLREATEGEPDEAVAVYRPPIPDLFRVTDAIVRMRTRLAEVAHVEPFAAFLPPMPRIIANRELVARSAVSSTFMAALELARGAELALAQDTAFQSIVVIPVATTVPEPARLNPGGA